MFGSSLFNVMGQNFINSFMSPFNNPMLEMFQSTMNQMSSGTAADPGEPPLNWFRFFQGNGKGTDGSSPSQRFEALEKNLFKSTLNAYEKEISRIFRMPQLGLTKPYQDRMNKCMDEFNRFLIEMGQFNTLLASPMGKAVMEVEDYLAAASSMDPQEIYNHWIKVLEKRYLELFRSPDFIFTFHRVVTQYSVFHELQEQIFKDFLKYTPVSSKEDFDEVAKDNYNLKKEIRQIKKRVESLEKKLNVMVS
jgi:hypothetical protein